MQANPAHKPPFFVHDYAVRAIELLRPAVECIRRSDRDLGEQLRRSLSSVALNISEGNRNQGGHRIARFSTAAGSAAESRTALKVAIAWGYIKPSDIEDGYVFLDRIGGMLHRLGARR